MILIFQKLFLKFVYRMTTSYPNLKQQHIFLPTKLVVLIKKRTVSLSPSLCGPGSNYTSTFKLTCKINNLEYKICAFPWTFHLVKSNNRTVSEFMNDIKKIGNIDCRCMVYRNWKWSVVERDGF